MKIQDIEKHITQETVIFDRNGDYLLPPLEKLTLSDELKQEVDHSIALLKKLHIFYDPEDLKKINTQDKTLQSLNESLNRIAACTSLAIIWLIAGMYYSFGKITNLGLTFLVLVLLVLIDTWRIIIIKHKQ